MAEIILYHTILSWEIITLTVYMPLEIVPLPGRLPQSAPEQSMIW